MNPKNKLLLGYEEFINEKNKIKKISNEIYPKLFLSNEVNFLSFNEFNDQMLENITLEDIKNIMNTPQIDLLGEEEKDIMEEVYFIKEQNNSKMELQSKENSTKTVNLSDKENSIKIQVHFITFLIQFANDIIKNILGNKKNYHFIDIKYNIKKIVNHDYVESLKQLHYSDILQKAISPKTNKFDENSNKKLYEELIEESELIRKIFDKKYLYIFQKYYFSLKDNESETDFEGIKIKLKPFTHLLRKNENEKDKFKNVVQDVFFSYVNYLIGKKFVTKTLV